MARIVWGISLEHSLESQFLFLMLFILLYHSIRRISWFHLVWLVHSEGSNMFFEIWDVVQAPLGKVLFVHFLHQFVESMKCCGIFHFGADE